MFSRRVFFFVGVYALAALAGVPATGATGGDSITSPDTDGIVGLSTSIALDGAGNPVVSYWDQSNSSLKLLHCNDPNCTGGDESITTVDTTGFFTGWTALVLDAAGNPVVSYYDNVNGDLKMLHCNDPNCAGGDESITAPDTADDVGWFFDTMALDASGNPVVSYNNRTTNELKVLHCNDPNCVGGDESIAAPDTGTLSSLALDGAGNPVVSFYDEIDKHLKVLHCNDPNCINGDDSIVVADMTYGTGRYTSLELDSAGNPVVSYCLNNPAVVCSELRVLHCGNPNCTANNTIFAPDLGYFSSLVLDGAGNPVVSYYDNINTDLKVLHCGDPACAGAQSVGGIAELPPGAGTPLATPDSSGSNSKVLAAVAAAVAACAITLGGAAWYARRRRPR